MNRFTEVRTVDTSPLTLQLPKELLKVPVRITVEPEKPRRSVDSHRNKAVGGRKASALMKSIEEHSWVMGEKLYRSRDELYERR